MHDSLNTKKRVGLVVKPDAHAMSHAKTLVSWLLDRGVSVVSPDTISPDSNIDSDVCHMPDAAADDLFCLFVLGGDGTFLRAVRWVGTADIPILGIKFGKIGFLAEITQAHLLDAVSAVMENRFTVEHRSRLCVHVVRSGEIITKTLVLNDMVINKGALARLAHIQTWIGERMLTTYRADGLIVATPTGSTAYSLAAGGPILHPAVPGIILTPICPFTLTNRPLIVPDTSSIRIEIGDKSASMHLTFDGQADLDISDADTVLVEKSPHAIRMITLFDHNFYDVLKARLHWSGGKV